MTNCISINNFDYSDTGQEDDFISPAYDLTDADTAFLSFDLAYARYSNFFWDRLLVLASSDCAQNYIDTVYDKASLELATRPDANSSFTPSSSSDWRREVVDLTDYLGGNLAISFKNVNGYGNNLYIDNVNLVAVSFPLSDFEVSQNRICIDDELIINDASVGAVEWEWDFGIDASPATSDNQGPHTVMYSSKGQKTIQLITTASDGDKDTSMFMIEVYEYPEAGFSYTQNGLNVDFVNESVNGANFLWEFGDGQISSSTNPSYTYSNDSNFVVTLTVWNVCDTVSFADTLYLETALSELSEEQVRIFPNPAKDEVHVQYDGQSDEYVISFSNINGIILKKEVMKVSAPNETRTIDIRDLPRGTYLLRVESEEGFFVQRVILD